MFCPKCGVENSDNGKFCRKCGTNLSGIAEVLESGDESISEEPRSIGAYVDPTGISSSFGHDPGSRGVQRNDPDHLWAGGIRNTICGVGFLVVAMALFLTDVAGGQSWWWAMLIPGFSMIGGGIGSIAKAKRLEKRMVGDSDVTRQKQLIKNEKVSLPPKQTDYVSPESLNYNTGDLVPSSVIDNTTRHLEMDKEGETMTLPKK